MVVFCYCWELVVSETLSWCWCSLRKMGKEVLGRSRAQRQITPPFLVEKGVVFSESSPLKQILKNLSQLEDL